jgi:integrase
MVPSNSYLDIAPIWFGRSISIERLKQMKVSQFASQIIESRPYKYQTKQTYYKDLKRLGIWDLEIDEIDSVMIRNRVETIPTLSTRKRLYITARTIFKEIGKCQDLPQIQVQGKIYDLPTQEQLEWIIDKSKYRLQLLLCMYAGLRVGEACAITPKKLQKDYLMIDQAYSQDGLHLGSPKSYGTVRIPTWLAEEIRNMKEVNYWKIGVPTTRVTHSCFKLSKNREWREMTNGKKFNPHMLRHWYATDMIRRGISPEIVRRQMRHANVNVTLQIYTQIRDDELSNSLPIRPSRLARSGNLTNLILFPAAR